MSELKLVAKQELWCSNCTVSHYNKDLALQANEKTEVVSGLWHRLVLGDGQRSSNDGAGGRKWLLSASPYR